MGKSAAAYIASTHTTPIAYVGYEDGPEGGVPHVARKVIIQGGANVPNKVLVTPKGTITPVDAEELDFLKTNKDFLKHQKAGFVQILIRDPGAEKAARDMAPKDRSAPYTAGDFAKAPTSGVPA